MDFFFLVLTNAALFIRPAEILPALGNFQAYQFLIAICFLLSLGKVMAQLSPAALAVRPMTVCVLGMLFMVTVSLLGNLDNLFLYASEYAKVVVYYLLMLAVIDRPSRLKTMLFWLGIFATFLVGVAVLRYHGLLVVSEPKVELTRAEKSLGLKSDELPITPYVKENLENPDTGEVTEFIRLCGTGVFHDPNDLSLIIVTGMLIALYFMGEKRHGVLRFGWVGPFLMFGYALKLTASRGGFMGFMAGLGVLAVARYGLRKSIMLGCLALPIVMAAFGGRMTSLSTNETTAGTRLQLWSDGLTYFREDPLLGIGMQNYGPRSGEVAHNSFLHCFAELGFVGGACFLGMFYIALMSLTRLTLARSQIADPNMRRLLPFMLALVAASAVGILSLSRPYDVPTYTLLGMAGSYCAIARTYPPVALPRSEPALFGRIALLSFVFMAAMFVFVRLFVRW